MLGCDIVEINRIKSAYNRFGEKFINKILSEGEKVIFYKRKKNGLAFLAGRFAAKESISKTLKTGLGELWFTDIEILPSANGAPQIFIRGTSRSDLDVSISHCKDYAIAVSVLR